MMNSSDRKPPYLKREKRRKTNNWVDARTSQPYREDEIIAQYCSIKEPSNLVGGLKKKN